MGGRGPGVGDKTAKEAEEHVPMVQKRKLRHREQKLLAHWPTEATLPPYLAGYKSVLPPPLQVVTTIRLAGLKRRR